MAHWDSIEGKIVWWTTKPCKNYPGWEEVDCGCCCGIEWGGDQPRECRHCGGGGIIYKHKHSGALALYPGGQFVGREKPNDNI